MRGFTLVELLVVVLVIGILAAIAIPALLGQRQRAHDAEAKSVLRNAQSAAETYFAVDQSYEGISFAELKAIEPSLEAPDATYGIRVDSREAGPGDYIIYTRSKSGVFYGVFQNATTGLRPKHSCSPSSRRGGCQGNTLFVTPWGGQWRGVW